LEKGKQTRVSRVLPALRNAMGREGLMAMDILVKCVIALIIYYYV
jgi:hypothetical protein